MLRMAEHNGRIYCTTFNYDFFLTPHKGARGMEADVMAGHCLQVAVSENLNGFGIPAGCCSDGPSGMRLDCGTKAFSLPNGTMIASSFYKELTSELFTFMGLEMAANKVDCLLGPGMNIHRHPLNGRNFEYFSEDPFLTGNMAAAELKGMAGAGVNRYDKALLCEQSVRQTGILSRLGGSTAERALREIYLKGFEIAVKEGGASSVMTTYGRVNGSVDGRKLLNLNTVILREEWGFKGFTMTVWWANINVQWQRASTRRILQLWLGRRTMFTWFVLMDKERP